MNRNLKNYNRILCNLPKLQIYKNECKNIIVTIGKEVKYSPILVYLTLGLLKVINNEEKVFWIVAGLFKLQWTSILRSEDYSYLGNFHLYIISKFIKNNDIDHIKKYIYKVAENILNSDEDIGFLFDNVLLVRLYRLA